MAKPPKVQEPSSQPDPDAKISLAFLECFSTPAGKAVLDYLRSSFVLSIMPGTTTSEQLFYREGARSVVGICDARIEEAKRG